MPVGRQSDHREQLLALADSSESADREWLEQTLAELRGVLLSSREALQSFLQTCPEAILQAAWERAEQRCREPKSSLTEQLDLDFAAPAPAPWRREVIFRADPATGTYHATRPVTLEELRAFWQDWLEAEFRRTDYLFDIESARQYLLAHLAHRDQQVFAGVFLDSRNGVLGYEELFFGSIHGISVHTRRVVMRALARNARMMIVARNYPSGQPPPQLTADERIYAELRRGLALIDIEMMDYFVIAGPRAISLQEQPV